MSNKYKAILHKVDSQGYDENGHYFGVPYFSATGELLKVFRIESDDCIEDFIRAASAKAAMAAFYQHSPGIEK